MSEAVGPEITRFLEAQGRNFLGQPLYRVVWSDDQFEWRHGTFNDYFGDIFLRTYTGVRYAPKYTHVKERFVLEKWFSGEAFHDDRLPESGNGSYEPLFVFQDKDFNPLEVNLRVVEILVYHDRRMTKPDPSDDRELEKLAETKEYQELYDSIDISPLMSLLHTKEGIVRP